MTGILRAAVRQAARRLLQAPGFTLTATLTIALGVGATATVFAVIDATLLRPLPYEHPDRLVTIGETRRGEPISVSYLNFRDWQLQSTSFEELAAFVGRSVTVSGPESAAERVRGQLVSANLFRALGVTVERGRTFSDEEASNPGARVVLLSHALWARRFGLDSAIVGRTITIDGAPVEVIGVMPRDFDFPGGIVYGASEAWFPIGGLDARDMADRGSHPGLYVLGRMRDGVTLDAARREISALAARLALEHPETNRDQGAIMRSALDELVGDVVPGLTIIGVAVFLLLAITAANVAGLQLARTFTRRREIVIRAALGASRATIVVHLLAESLLVAALGAVVGVLLAFWGVHAARPLLANLPRMAGAAIDWQVVLFAIGTTTAAATVFGVAPARAATGHRLDRWLRDRGASLDHGGASARRVLVAGEVAVSLVLVVGALLLGRSLGRLQAESGGVNAEGVLTFETRLPDASYQGTQISTFYREVLGEIAALPGVKGSGATSLLPMGGSGSQSGMQPLDRTGESVRTDVSVVTPDYFRSMGIGVRRGRAFTAADDSGSDPVAIVDEELAAHFWPGEDPIGKQVSGWGFPALTVVGVVGHVKNYGVNATSRQELYVPHAQRPFSRMVGVVRVQGDPATFVPALRRIIGARDQALAVYNVRAMRDVVGGTVAGPRLAATLSGFFAVLSLLLAAVGLFGVLAFVVGQRTREFGVRMALGATPGGIVRGVLRQSLGLAAAGIVPGAVAALAAGRLLRSQLYGVGATDPAALAVAAGAFLLVALLASWWPARRAARVAPTEALREP